MSISWHNGVLSHTQTSAIQLHSPGLLAGDGIFETLAVYEGRAFALEQHLDRLENSAQTLGLQPLNVNQVRHAVHEIESALDLTKSEVGRMRITVWRSANEFAAAAGHTSIEFAVTAGKTSAPALGHVNSDAASVLTSRFVRNQNSAITGHKSTSYAENLYAVREAQRSGATEAVFFNTAGDLSEGSMSNVVVAVGSQLLTPALSAGCLPGITRRLALEWAQDAGLPLREAEAGELTRGIVGKPAALLGTLRNVQAISAWDKIVLPENPLLVELAAVFAAKSLSFHNK